MELVNYRLESNSQVRLYYKDGRQKLIAKDQLSTHLLPADIERVQYAFTLRQAYFKDLPKWVKVIGIGILALGLGIGGVKAAPGIQHALHQVVPIVPDVTAKSSVNQPIAETRSSVAPVVQPVAVPVVPPAAPTPAPAQVSADVPTVSATAIPQAKSKGELRKPVRSTEDDLRAVLDVPSKLLRSLELR